MGDDFADEDNFSGHSGLSAPSLSAMNMMKHSTRYNGYPHPHNFETPSHFNFDTKEEHTFYVNQPHEPFRASNDPQLYVVGGANQLDGDDDSSVGDFVVEPNVANPPSSSSATLKVARNHSNNSSFLTGSLVDSTMQKKISKKVSFAEGTIIPKEDHLALSITKHLYTKELGYTQYHIQMLYKGIEWTVLKRYRDFASFHQKLQIENAKYQIPLPELPKKRWFEKQRWLNKFDESYSLHRKNALQDYLRILAKTPLVKNKFETFHEFLEIPLEKIREQEEDAFEEPEESFSESSHNKYPLDGNQFIHDFPASQPVVHSKGNSSQKQLEYPDFDEIVEGGRGVGDSSFYPPPPSSSLHFSQPRSVHNSPYYNHHQGSPPPQRPQHHQHSRSRNQYSHPKADFRDSILETPLNQQFDDNGDIIISRP